MQIPNDNVGISASLIRPKPFKFYVEALLEGRSLSKSRERTTGVRVDVFLSSAPQSLRILTHGFDRTGFQSKKGDLKGVVRKGSAEAGVRASHEGSAQAKSLCGGPYAPCLGRARHPPPQPSSKSGAPKTRKHSI